MQTFSITLTNRFNDAERILGMFSSSGFKIEKLSMSKMADSEISRLTVVATSGGRDVTKLLIRLRQQLRVTAAEVDEGDLLPD